MNADICIFDMILIGVRGLFGFGCISFQVKKRETNGKLFAPSEKLEKRYSFLVCCRELATFVVSR